MRTSIGSSFVYICVGHFANTLLPFRLGDAARAYLAGSRFGVRLMTIRSDFEFRPGDLVLTVVTVALIAGAGVAGVSRVTLLVLASVGLGSALIVSVSRRAVMRTLGARLPRLAHQVGALSDAFASVRSPQRFALLALTTATSFGAAVVIMHLVLSAAGTDLGWWPTAVAISAMTLSTAIPAAPGALGTYEFAGTTALTAFESRRTPHSQQSWLFMCWQLCHRQSSGSGDARAALRRARHTAERSATRERAKPDGHVGFNLTRQVGVNVESAPSLGATKARERQAPGF